MSEATAQATVSPIDIEQLDTLLRERRTIHEFKSDSPPRESVMRALDAARWVPNHHVSQPWRFYLVGPETREQIARLNAELIAQRKGADAGEDKYQRWRAIPGWMVVTCQNSEDALRAKEDYASCCCAIHNFSLCLWSEGLGVKWTTGPVTRDDAFYDVLWIDREVETVVGLVWYGYAAEVPMTARQPLAQVMVEMP
jgi:nitroreductase